MLKIGDFSKMSKVTIRTLRFYEKEKLLSPTKIDKTNGYRYYENRQLLDLARIISLKQTGLSIDEIKKIVLDNEPMLDILKSKKIELEGVIKAYEHQLSKLNYLIKEKNMKEEIFEKTIPACCVYYKEGTVKQYSDLSDFIQTSGVECLALNPDLKCATPDYCFVNYLDGEYKDHDIKVRYSQAVVKNKENFNENNNIKFMELPDSKCICIYHKGAYDNLGESYAKIMKYIEDNKITIIDYPRECYIDGIWNKENTDDWLTEIQIPIK